MEVHHHPQVEKKSFREYLLEGLMIFLAVTMGFIAENIRENIAENKKVKELAESLYQEVYSDSIVIQQKINLRFKKEAEMIYLRDYFRDSSLEKLSDRVAPAMVWSYIVTNQSLFEPKDGILTQLKNASTLKFFKNAQLQNAVGSLSVSIARLRIRNDQEYSFVASFTRPFLLKYFDFRWFDNFSQEGKLSLIEALNQPSYPSFPFKINNKNELKRNDAENLVSYYLLLSRATRQIHYQEYIKTNHELLQALRANYHL